MNSRFVVKVLLKLFGRKFIEKMVQIECKFSMLWVSAAHKRLMGLQWNFLPEPEHFDHNIDLFYQWRETRNSLWLERGIYGSLALSGGKVLELACGDGFNSRNFYSLRSTEVVACDFDPSAIATAVAKNSAPNVKFVLADIRSNMPNGQFGNVVWDAAIEHFTPEEISGILGSIKNRLAQGGILSGYTMVEREHKSLSHHEYEFKGKEDLYQVLKPHFKNVTVFETIYPERHNLYFWASDFTIPFSSDWKCFKSSIA